MNSAKESIIPQVGKDSFSSTATEPISSVDKSPTSSKDALQATGLFNGDTRIGLEKLRSKLLDLSRRNPLLNFKHGKKTIRIVDGIPDIIYRDLLDFNKAFTVRPVHQPNVHSLTEEQQRKLNERSLRDRVIYVARDIYGMQVDYDLPCLDSRRAPRPNHRDQYLQTLHFPDALESLLRNIASAARLTIEETGSNYLHLSFGFLEWLESQDSQIVNAAPLLLLPVEIRKLPTPKGNTFSYELSFTGEEPIPNQSLIELVRQQFGISIPILRSDELPEAYWERVTEAVRDEAHWRIRRWVTLGLFQYRKLLMLHDLDPECWPASCRIDRNPKISSFFEGKWEANEQFSQDLDIDSLELKERELPLIEDADSSQHTAIVHAIRGRDIVVEGPPGTGKSQTITNLIAVALERGQTVLFVSEKLAALEVVKHRLNRNGLGSFCLELHSEKTKKGAFFEDLAQRLQQRFAGPREYETKLVMLRKGWNFQQRLLSVLTSIAEPTPYQIHEVLRRGAHHKIAAERALYKSQGVFEDLFLANPLIVPFERIEEVGLLVHEFTKAVKELVGCERSLREHPWYGVTALSQECYHHQLAAAGRDFYAATEALTKELSEFSATYDAEPIDEIPAIEKLLAAYESLRSKDGQLWFPVLESLASGRQDALEGFLTQLNLLYELDGKLKATLNTNSLSRLEEVALCEAATSLLGLNFDLSVPFCKVAPIVAELDEAIAFTRQIIVTNKALRSGFHVSPAPSVYGLDFLNGALTAIDSAPKESLHLRSERLQTYESGQVIEELRSDAMKLHAQRDELTNVFVLTSTPPLERVQETHTILSGTHVLSMFSKKWRLAKKTYTNWVGGKQSSFRHELACQHLASLSEYILGVSEFTRSERGRAACGDMFQGIETDFDGLLKVARWQQLVSQRFLSYLSEENASFLGCLLASPAACFREVCNVTPKRFSEGLAHLGELLFKKLPAIGISPFEVASWEGLLEELAKVRQSLSTAFSAISVSEATLLLNLRTLFKAKDLIARKHALVTELDETKHAALFGSQFHGHQTDRATLLEHLNFWSLLKGSEAPANFVRAIAFAKSSIGLSKPLCSVQLVHDRFNSFRQKRDAFFSMGKIAPADWGQSSQSLSSIDGKTSCALGSLHRLEPLFRLNDTVHRLREAGLGRLVGLIFRGELPLEELSAVTEACIWVPFCNDLVKRFPELQKAGTSLDSLRENFAKLDIEILELTKTKLAARIGSRHIPLGFDSPRVAEKTELALIKHQVKLQRHSVSLRELLNRAGKAVLAAKPCFMMSPLAVAQYLERGRFLFDLVIMDEASQMRPEDALGAIARAKQCVIVGDSKQLPPSTFFDRMASDDDPEGTVVEESESILEAASGMYRPTCQLKWHYRSLHEQLIGFSNHFFYNGNLVVFPSPHGASSEYGVKFHKVPGVYHGHKNEIEARKVAEVIVRHIISRPTESLGVVAMNLEQTQLIEEVLDDLLRDDPVAQKARESFDLKNERLFIKNLENVQGDERDVIFISVTYGRDEQGDLRRYFGPINMAKGWRRLNVLFTRARKRVHLFTSMSDEDFPSDGDISEGARSLRSYLKFARTGLLPTEKQTNRKPDSYFEEDVARMLANRGYDCQPQLGVANFFIDIAVRDPIKPGRFLLGIECDGASYHSSRSVRDRDRLRQLVLERMGWSIHRIWSTDWFRNPSYEIDRVIRRLEQEMKRANALEKDESAVYDQAIDMDAIHEIAASETTVRSISSEQSFIPSPELAIGIGDSVRLQFDDDEEELFVQITRSPSNPEVGTINEKTPIATAILGRRENEVVTALLPSGKRQIRIVRVLQHTC